MSPLLRLSCRVPHSFWLLPLLCKVVSLVCVGFFWVWLLFVLWWKEISFLFFPLWWAGPYEVAVLFAEDWVCVFILFFFGGGEASYTGCCWQLGDARCIQVEAFMGILTNKYSLGLGGLQRSRLLSVLPLQRFWAWSLAREVRFHR